MHREQGGGSSLQAPGPGVPGHGDGETPMGDFVHLVLCLICFQTH